MRCRPFSGHFLYCLTIGQADWIWNLARTIHLSPGCVAAICAMKEGVIHRGRRPRWITPSEICRILHILRKPKSIIALLFIQNITSFLKEFRHFALCFSAHQIQHNLIPKFSRSMLNNLQRAALLTSFWRHRFNNFRRAALLTSLIQWRRFFPNLVNSSWLWWIMRVVLTNQKRGNILNE